MAITEKPKRHPFAPAKLDPLEFIAGAEKGEQAPPHEEPTKPQKRRKEPVIIRFDEKTLQQIDQAAEKRGLSRAALVLDAGDRTSAGLTVPQTSQVCHPARFAEGDVPPHL